MSSAIFCQLSVVFSTNVQTMPHCVSGTYGQGKQGKECRGISKNEKQQ